VIDAMEKVLVTGASGGLGKALVVGLRARGVAVKATGRRDGQALVRLGADYVPADLVTSDLDALTTGVDGVFHCAALSSPWGRDADFQAINVAVTQGLLASARRAGCKRFVFVSSPSVYAREGDHLGLREEDAINSRPLNAYARTKGEAERLVLDAADGQMACVAIRPRAIIGPDDEVLLPRFLRVIEKGRFPRVRGGNALIELTDVRDVVAALMTAYEQASALSGEVINISGGRAITVRDLVNRLADALGKPVRFIDLPYGLLRTWAAISERVCGLLPGRPEPILTVYSLATLSFSQTFDLTKARRMLDYTPAHDAVETALAIARQIHGH
jgi:2-alkyl-3-oxoalkanoate reductase